MMTSPVGRRQPVSALAALLATLLLLGALGAPPQAGTLRLSSAPVSLEYPSPWKEWAVSLGAYADSAAAQIHELIGVPLPSGTILWEPAASGPGSTADGVVEVRPGASGTVVVIRTNVPLLMQDYGAAYALGYGRWLGAYAVARIALGAPGGNPPWWTEGAALYLTDRLFRDAHTTTPVLYGIESNFIRAAQTRRPVDLAAAELTPAARGKAYATFRLLESLYGADTTATAVGRLVSRPSAELATIVDAIGRDKQPDPDALLRDWLEPTAFVDLTLERARVHDDGTLEVRVARTGAVPVPVDVQVRTADGQLVDERAVAGTDEVRFDIQIPAPPTAVVVDPVGLVPDVNRANNRQGFGNAANVERFFSFDDSFAVGELQFDGDIALDETEQRTESFSLRITNRTDRQTGLGFLVSASWSDRPERVQRAYWVPLGPRETRVVRERMAYPNRGTGRARVEARFWQAGSVEQLTAQLVSDPPGSTSNYILLRDAPDAPRRPAHSLFRQPPQITETEGTLARPADDEAADTSESAGAGGSEPSSGSAADDTGFGVTLSSPSAGDLPVGDTVLEARVRGAERADRVQFFVNEHKVGEALQPPYRLRWSYPEDEQAFVIRAVALAGDRLASDEVVLDRAAVSFGSTVDLVTIHVTVRDSAGRLVRGLQPEDFRLREDGVAQKIVQLDFGETPVSAALLLDQSSSMIGAGVRAERAGARRLVDALVSDVNRVMILGFNDRVYVYSGFTADTERLDSALEAIDPDGSTALFDTLAEAVRKVNRHRGKRALVVLSDGLDTDSAFDFEDVVEYLRQADVLVYTIGLQLMQEGSDYGDASGAVKKGIERLRTLAEATGGAAYVPLALDELEEIYGSIADELNSQYALSYYPSDRRFDGSWRPIRVEVPGHPGYLVQAREGYYGVGRNGS